MRCSGTPVARKKTIAPAPTARRTGDGPVIRDGEGTMKTMGTVGLVMMALAFAAGGAAAQEVIDTPYTGPKQVVSVNPFGIVFEWFNLEYERRLSPTVTAGAAGSYVGLDNGDDHYFSANALLRYYPQGRALTGFYFGGRTGIYDVSEGNNDEVFFGFGFEIGYTWLLGVNDNFQISLGAGASRVFGGTLDGSEAIPTVRLLNVGIGF
jgi:hypothetical protein